MFNEQRVVAKCVSMATVFAGAVALFSVGCSGQASGDGQSGPAAGESAESASTVLAELKTSDGTEYSFLQTRTGDLVIGVGSDHAIDLSDALNKTPSLTALYEKLSGTAAPEQLRLADVRLAEQKAKGEAQAPNSNSATEFNMGKAAGLPATSDGVGRSTQLLSKAAFEDKFCNSGWDFLYCWSDTGGNPAVQRYSYYFQGAMSATNCNTRFRFRYYDDGDWYTIVDRIASPGSYWHYYQYGSSRSRRFEILNNDGCGVRFAAFGNL